MEIPDLDASLVDLGAPQFEDASAYIRCIDEFSAALVRHLKMRRTLDELGGSLTAAS